MKAIVLNDGVNAKPIHDYIAPVYKEQGKKMLDELNLESYLSNLADYDKLVADFEAANPKQPLTQYHTPGERVPVSEVWQYQDPINQLWISESKETYVNFDSYKDYSEYSNQFVVKTRLAFEVVSEEESKTMLRNPTMERLRAKITPEQEAEFERKWNEAYPPLSLEEAAEKYLHSHPDFKSEGLSDYMNGLFNGHIEGQNHILESGEYVKLSDVKRIVNSNWCPCNDDLCDTNIVVNNILTTLKNKQ